MSSIDSPPSREKFRLMSTVTFILQEPFTSLRRGIKHANWKYFCATLFGFNSAELKWDNDYCLDLLIDPTSYKHNWANYAPSPMYGHFAETKRFVPEPVLSHRLAIVAISCMRYLHRLDFNTLPSQNHFLASWATRSKQLPWLWRRRMRVTSMRRRRPTWNHDEHKFSFSQKLRRSHQIIYSEIIQSHQEQRIFYTWTLDLLYHTLRKAMKSDMLTRALSKPFISSLAPILFPRRVKRVRKAAEAYLEKVSRRVFCLGRSDDEPLHSQFGPSTLDASSVEEGVRHNMRGLPQSNLIAIDDDGPESSRRVSGFSHFGTQLQVIRSSTRFSSQERTRQRRI